MAMLLLSVIQVANGSEDQVWTAVKRKEQRAAMPLSPK
jgi:hypothetical protein